MDLSCLFVGLVIILGKFCKKHWLDLYIVLMEHINQVIRYGTAWLEIDFYVKMKSFQSALFSSQLLGVFYASIFNLNLYSHVQFKKTQVDNFEEGSRLKIRFFFKQEKYE